MAGRKRILAIVGRPNVGKSTLFNRLVRGKKAIVEDVPGVTRDRLYADARWDGREFVLVDTGGFVPDADSKIGRGVHLMAEVAVEEADAVIFLMDARDGLMPDDMEAYRYLRRSEKPIYPVVNKVDGPKQEDTIYDFYSLGVDKIYSISAQHKLGIGELMDDVIGHLTGKTESIEKGDMARVAIVGRPNVGKSSLLNKLLGSPRVLVDEVPGTTRDSIDTIIHRDKRPYILTDTAGIRRKSRITLSLEGFSVFASLKSIDRSDVALVMLDASEGPTVQDQRIARFVHDKGKGAVILVNKWDIVLKDEKTAGKYASDIEEDMRPIGYAPIIFTSTVTGKNLNRIFPAIDAVLNNREMRIPTPKLNSFFEEIKKSHSPGLHRGREIKLYYITQAEKSPPTFIVFTNNPKAIKPAYERYIMNSLRDRYDFSGTPIRIIFKMRK